MYQAQFPGAREPAAEPPDAAAAGGRPPRRLDLCNFYSPSLCRKSNASHLKKQAGGRVRIAQEGNALGLAHPSKRAALVPAPAGTRFEPRPPMLPLPGQAPSTSASLSFSAAGVLNSEPQAAALSEPSVGFAVVPAPLVDEAMPMATFSGVGSSMARANPAPSATALPPIAWQVSARRGHVSPPRHRGTATSPLFRSSSAQQPVPFITSVIVDVPSNTLPFTSMFRSHIALALLAKHNSLAFRQYFNDFPIV